jgi:hypothetical protein
VFFFRLRRSACFFIRVAPFRFTDRLILPDAAKANPDKKRQQRQPDHDDAFSTSARKQTQEIPASAGRSFNLKISLNPGD